MSFDKFVDVTWLALNSFFNVQCCNHSNHLKNVTNSDTENISSFSLRSYDRIPHIYALSL